MKRQKRKLNKNRKDKGIHRKSMFIKRYLLKPGSISLLLAGIVLQSCLCPDPTYIAFDPSQETVEVLTDDYYIKAVIITEYIPREGFIELVDASKSSIVQAGGWARTILKLSDDCSEQYMCSGKPLREMLKIPYLEYRVQLEKFKNKQRQDGFDVEEVVFTKTSSNKKMTYNSTHPCP
jgi:hypothetical protein